MPSAVASNEHRQVASGASLDSQGYRVATKTVMVKNAHYQKIWFKSM